MAKSIYGAAADLPRPKVKVALPPPRPPVRSPDSRPFDRVVGALGGFGAIQGLNGLQVLNLATSYFGVADENTRPVDLPYYILDMMAYDPWVYLGEQILLAIVADPGVYYIHHEDRAIRAEAEMWTQQFLPELLTTIGRALAYDSAIYILDWAADDFTIKVDGDDGETRNKNFKNYAHYSAIHDVHPTEALLRARRDTLETIEVGGVKFAHPSRAFMSVWAKQHGNWLTRMGSRRRCWRSYYRDEMNYLLQGRYLERSVDPLRVGYAPSGTIEIDGVEIPSTTILTDALMSLKGGGAAVLPSTRDPDSGEPYWSIDVLQFPDVHQVWHAAASQSAGEKMVASLIPPGAAGDDMPSGSAKVAGDALIYVCQNIARWIAREASKCLAEPHRLARKGKSRTEQPPVLRARELPRAKMKRLSELFKAVAMVPRKVGDRETTFAEMIDDTFLDDVGLPKRPLSDALRDPAAETQMKFASANKPPAPDGRPSDAQSGKEQRRENATTADGEEDTAQKGDD